MLFFGQNILKTINTFSSLAREFMRYPPRRPRTPFNKEIKQMGRPIKKLFIGNRNTLGIGGEGLVSVTLGGTNNSTGYTNVDALTISAPNLPGGVQAVATITETAGVIDGVIVVDGGSGYTSALTITAGTGTQGNLTLTGVLSTTTSNAIAILAFVTGGSSAVIGDINSQKGSKIYNVTTAQGTSECLLVTSEPVEGQLRITATDSAGGTYFVKKLTNRTAVVLPGTGVQFAEDAKVAWADTAVENVSVALTN